MGNEENPKVEFEEALGPTVRAVLGCVEPSLLQVSALHLFGLCDFRLLYNNLNFII